jgi:uncharacterized protein (TIGR03790 family)
MKTWHCLIAIAGLFLAVVDPVFAGGDEVVLVYNSRLPESKDVADHYAEVRAVPTNQIFGFDLTTNEDVSRSEFRDLLQKPLAKTLEDEKLWRISPEIMTDTNTGSSRVLWKVVESKIRYAVLCFGIPLHITEDTSLVEPGEDNAKPEMRRNEAAVDNELACLPFLEEHYSLFGPLKNQFYTTTNAGIMCPTNGILLVTRLDGPTAAIARGLVDKAVEAETNGLWGRAYFDIRGITDPNYKIGDDWIRGAEEITRLCGFETVMDTNAATFPAGYPMDHIALYAGWYDSDVSGPFSRPTVEFMPGAFAYHLHSYSAATLRSTTKNWCGPLLAKGATATMGCVAEPYLQGTPDIGTFFGRFLFYGFNFAEAAYASQAALSWQTTVIGDPLYRPFGKIRAEQHADLLKRHSQFLEWSELQFVNLAIVEKRPLAQVAAYLEDLDLAKQSAVLTEKLADIYSSLGKPSSAIRSFQAALKLDPSPLQRLRLRLDLGEKLVEQGRNDEARDDYQAILDENPDYPDRDTIIGKLAALAAASAGTNAPAQP